MYIMTSKEEYNAMSKKDRKSHDAEMQFEVDHDL